MPMLQWNNPKHLVSSLWELGGQTEEPTGHLLHSRHRTSHPKLGRWYQSPFAGAEQPSLSFSPVVSFLYLIQGFQAESSELLLDF